MPIRAEQKALYPKDWKAISLRIREREGQKCKTCKAPNGQIVWRSADGAKYMLERGEVFSSVDGEYLGMCKGSEYNGGNMVKIVLTVAHLDHDPTNNDDANLAALCQKCHLTYDAKHHAKNAHQTRRSRKAIGDLLA